MSAPLPCHKSPKIERSPVSRSGAHSKEPLPSPSACGRSLKPAAPVTATSLSWTPHGEVTPLCSSTGDFYCPDYPEQRFTRLSAVELAGNLSTKPRLFFSGLIHPRQLLLVCTVHLHSLCTVHCVSHAKMPSKGPHKASLHQQAHQTEHCSPGFLAWKLALGPLLAGKGRPKTVGG